MPNRQQRHSISGETIKMLTCDVCGRMFSGFSFVETIEEYLCENCASGYDPDESDDEFMDDIDA
jgi:protein-arginine kinase activator protein McsA